MQGLTMKIATLLAVLIISAQVVMAQNARAAAAPEGVVQAQFIGDPLPTPSVHASTIVQADKTLLAAWFGGTEEGARDVVIWLSRNEGSGWSKPEEVANGVYENQRIQYPCWNPVLHKLENGTLVLWYREGPDPVRWWTLMKTSNDGGRTWSKAE